MMLARKSIFKLLKMELFENRKVSEWDELDKSKREEQQRFHTVHVHFITQILLY